MLVGSDKPSSFLCCCCCCLVLLSIRKSFTLPAWLTWGGSSWEADVTATGLGLMSIYNERSGHANGWMLVEMTMVFCCPSSPPAALVNELKNVGINFVKKILNIFGFFKWKENQPNPYSWISWEYFWKISDPRNWIKKRIQKICLV